MNMLFMNSDTCVNDYYENYELNSFVYSYDLQSSDKLALDLGVYLVDNKCSIRQVAKEFCLSKSYVHTLLHARLRGLSDELYACVRRQLRSNKLKYFRYA